MNSNVNSQAPSLLKLVGFNDNEKMTFESILSLANNRLEQPWQVAVAKKNVAFFVLSNRLRSQFDQDMLLQSLPREHELLVDKNNIPFLGAMSTLFNKLSSDTSVVKNISKLDAASALPQVINQIDQGSKPVSLGFFEKNKSSQLPKQTTSLVGSSAQVEKTNIIHKVVSESPQNLKPKSLGFFEKLTRTKKVETKSVSRELPEPQQHESSFVYTEKPISAIENKDNIYLKDKPASYFSHSIENIAPTDTIFTPANHPFIGRLLDSNTEQKLCFSLFNTGELYVDLQNKCYYSPSKLEELQVYFTCQGKFSLQKLTDNQLQVIVSKQALKPQPLKDLLWYAVFSCSQGNRIVDYQESDIVRLKRWPDINLPCCRELIKLAAYMHSNAVNLHTIQIKTKLAMAVIRDFYNACKVIGLIELCQEQDIHEKTMDSDKRKLYAKIGKRIKSIS